MDPQVPPPEPEPEVVEEVNVGEELPVLPPQELLPDQAGRGAPSATAPQRVLQVKRDDYP